MQHIAHQSACTTILKRAAMWAVCDHLRCGTDRSMPTGACRPEHADPSMPTGACRLEHADRSMPTVPKGTAMRTVRVDFGRKVAPTEVTVPPECGSFFFPGRHLGACLRQRPRGLDTDLGKVPWERASRRRLLRWLPPAPSVIKMFAVSTLGGFSFKKEKPLGSVAP